MQKKHLKKIHAFYNDDEVLISSVKYARAHHYKIKDVYSPYPVHGLDKAIGLSETRLAICAFLYSITGFSLAVLMIWYMMIHDWPMNIGGKPNATFFQNMLAFVPILFESTVLCTAHGMAITFLLRSWVLPGVKNKNPDPRTTDDLHLLEIIAEESKVNELVNALKHNGAIEVNTYEK